MKPTSFDGSRLVLTGERHAGHFEVRLKRGAAGLTYTGLRALVALVLSRAGAGSGFVRLSPVLVSRLRHALDRAAGPGTGEALIETGFKKEYRLAVPRERLRSLVAVEPSFFELEALKVISAEQAAQLRRLCRRVKSR